MSNDEQWLLEEKYGGEKSEAFFADCKRLTLGEPLGYLIGWVPFLNTKIWLNSHPLIPRPETEFWVEQAIQVMASQTSFANSSQTRILDLCAGSGCIGVAVAQALPQAHVDFAEIERAHLPTIEKNLQENCPNLNVPVNRCIWHSNLFSKIPTRAKYDFILTNPPYIDESLDRVEESVKVYEPAVALYGGRGGLEVIARLIATAPEYLTPHGQLWIEHEPEQTTLIHQFASEHGMNATTHKDQYSIERYSILLLK